MEGEMKPTYADVALREGKVAVMLDWAAVAGLAMSTEPGYGNEILRTAARETIARVNTYEALRDEVAQAIWSTFIPHPWETCAFKPAYLESADRIIAVLASRWLAEPGNVALLIEVIDDDLERNFPRIDVEERLRSLREALSGEATRAGCGE